MTSHLRGVLRRRHISMIAMGGVIGAGLFVGSGSVIHQAGPVAVVAYLLAGVLVLLVMRMLGEMAVAMPDTGSFSSYADRAIGRWAGFSIGWLYAWFWVVALGIEATAGAIIIHRWTPDLPQWMLAFGLMLVLSITNVVSVKFFGEFEYWFAGIKIAAIVIFLVLGALAIGGLLPGVTPPGITNLFENGGFAPNGLAAVVPALLVVVFSFFGSEIATIAAGESENPAAAVRSAVRAVVWRTLIFFVGSTFVIVTVVSWDSPAVQANPFVAVIESYGIPGAAVIMDVVVLVAVLSCLNSGIYTASRMLFSMAKRGEAPARLGTLTSTGNPRNAIIASSLVGFAIVALNYWFPEAVFLFLVSSAGAIALFVWLVVCVAQLRLRRHLERENRLPATRMWLFPYLTYATIAAILGLIAGMAVLPETRPALGASLVVAAAIVAIALFRRRARNTTRNDSADDPRPALSRSA
ncbi:amino acid permease [Agromyces aerolatus]|uniref:amino acid permease n=1 Tax=Agromyces sp. LY-1074 TaxID=3074080 RepID=UPI0028643207|nr:MULTISPECIES: amino acid permease [unclassified Agromyces]MDR5700580.1 amino acid permease [Agromyces sp. LY-1074]MDR5707101.1 amino acid permease [Agromyces sp. LY-1358]